MIMQKLHRHLTSISHVVRSNKCYSTLRGSKWDLMSAVSLERKPVIARQFTPLEENVQKFLLSVEFERSHKSDFEMRHAEDEKRLKSQKKAKLTEAELEQGTQQTAQDFLDACTEELKKFQFADRVTTEENNTQSLRRALDRNLLLLVEEVLGDKSVWMLPQGLHQVGESLRQTAERVLREKCGQSVVAKFFGNAPCGFYKYKYPKLKRVDGKEGVKVFFFKAQLVKGDVTLETGGTCLNYHWATRNEMGKLQNEYLKSVQMFLVDEEH